MYSRSRIFFFNDTATTEIYTLSLHDALPIYDQRIRVDPQHERDVAGDRPQSSQHTGAQAPERPGSDRKSTRLNSSHANISYAVFCLKKKKIALSHRSSC